MSRRSGSEGVEDAPDRGEHHLHSAEGEAGGDEPGDLTVARVVVGSNEGDRVAGNRVRAVPLRQTVEEGAYL